MKITMLETRRGCEDGHIVKRFEEGQTYDIADTLARSFIRAGWGYEPSTLEQQMLDASTSRVDELVDAAESAKRNAEAGMSSTAVLTRLFSDFNRTFSRPCHQNPQTHADLGKPV